MEPSLDVRSLLLLQEVWRGLQPDRLDVAGIAQGGGDAPSDGVGRRGLAGVDDDAGQGACACPRRVPVRGHVLQRTGEVDSGAGRPRGSGRVEIGRTPARDRSGSASRSIATRREIGSALGPVRRG